MPRPAGTGARGGGFDAAPKADATGLGGVYLFGTGASLECMTNPSTTLRDGETARESGRYRYRTGAKGLVTSAAKVLLVRERHVDGQPFWTLPGGGVHPHEAPEDGLVRELREELHCRAHVGIPRAQFCYVHESLASTVSLYTVFDCALLSDPTPDRGEGIDDVGWFGPRTLPATTLPQVKHICRRVADLPAHRAAADD